MSQNNLISTKEQIGLAEIKALYQPRPDSHKRDNGTLLIVGGSDWYHGAPLFAALMASKIVDLVYFCSTPENNKLIHQLKTKTAEFITVPRPKVFTVAKEVDVVLVGPGLRVSATTKKLTNDLLRRNKSKKFVLDADALKVIDKKLLGPNCIVTPHSGEFKILFGLAPTKANAIKMAKKYRCVIALKTVTRDFTGVVASPIQTKININGNAGMTKGGTGDVLAGLIAGLAAKNNLFLAAGAGLFINGLAGDRLKTKVSYYYSATDLITEIPKAIQRSLDFK